MPHDPRFHKLGKLAPRHDPRDLKLSKYLPTLPKVPAKRYWGGSISDWGVMGNDQWGDCTCAAVGHCVMEMTGDTGAVVTPTTAQVLSLYTTVTGEEGAAFNPATGANDNGCVIVDVLSEWRQNGFIGHKLGAYAAVDLKNISLLRAAIDLFGAVDIGLLLPVSAQSQDVWFLTDATLQGDAAPGSWGGHSVPLIGYNTLQKTFTCVTWGSLKLIKWGFLQAYMDEAWALLSNDWVSGSKPAPSGFSITQLQNDLRAVTG